MRVTRSRAREIQEQPIEVDLEFERTARQRARAQRQQEERMEQEAPRMAEERPPEIKLRDRAIPNVNDFRSSIAEPQVTLHDFELKPGLIQMVQQNQFGGGTLENPNVHIQRFLQICNTVRMNGVPSDTIRLQLFPFSLRDKAIEWLMSMPPGHFTMWNELSGAFLAKYFPPSKTAKIRHELTTFTQRDGETLYEAWERNKDLQRQCPHHKLPEWLLIENFYNGLDQTVRSALDAAAGGSLMGKSEVEARELIEEMALHNYQYGNPRGRPKGMFEMEAIQMLTAKLDQISHKVDSMNISQVSTSNIGCGACGMTGHQSSECLQVN